MYPIKDEGFQTKWKFAEKPEMDKAFIEQAIAQVLAKIDANLDTFSTKFPDCASVDGRYPEVENEQWTNSFWTGMLWLAYEVTGEGKYRKLAEKHVVSFKERLEKQIETETHDLGFLYSLSCIAAFQLTGNKEAREVALQAADLLKTRYHEKAGIIQAWGDLTNPEQQGRMIIDCNMNLPLLYWAAEQTGDQSYYEMAASHAAQAARYIVRQDSSTYHTFYMDIETGKPRFGNTHQGFSDESCWARGQAWGIYGFTLTYLYTKDESYLELAKKLAHYFFNRLPEDGICYWDLTFTDGDEERDSSAAAIVVCGLMELCKHLPLTDDLRTYYENAALHLLRTLALKYVSTNEEENGVLLHSVYVHFANKGVDEFCIWGDYFYFEALVRAMKSWRLYW